MLRKRLDSKRQVVGTPFRTVLQQDLIADFLESLVTNLVRANLGNY